MQGQRRAKQNLTFPPLLFFHLLALPVQDSSHLIPHSSPLGADAGLPAEYPRGWVRASLLRSPSVAFLLENTEGVDNELLIMSTLLIYTSVQL